MKTVNKSRTCTSDYCFIHRTPLVQDGNGFGFACPICGEQYEIDEIPEWKKQQERDEMFRRRQVGGYGMHQPQNP